eukprot:1087930-Prorocentrum_lima.AAC.1
MGDIVAFYRNPASKEASGWCGPAIVVHVETYGTICENGRQCVDMCMSRCQTSPDILVFPR